jgi:acyl-CoA synthetase (AMP-forming)/AMP-acid ligase II/acyl carrier protein
MATDPLANSKDRWFSDILAQRAAAHPTKDALVVVGTDGMEKLRLTYAELHEQVDRYASGLIERGLPGSRALMLFEPGVGFVVSFMGCLRAGVIAIPCHLAKPGRSTWNRLVAIVRDSDASCILTDAVSIPKLVSWFVESPELSSLRMLSPNDLSGNPAAIVWKRPSADAPAFLQYTSGSTGVPNGTIVTFGNLIANAGVVGPWCSFDFDATVVCWLPPYHDLGLIGNILQSLLDGSRCVLLPPVSVVQNPRRWLETISRYKATISMAPNFAYELCVRRIPPEKREGLDLSSWACAVNAAEPIRASTITSFTEAYRAYGFRAETFRPVYGLAEATLMVSVGEPGRPPEILWVDPDAIDDGRIVPAQSGTRSRAIVGSGKVRTPQQVAIVDPNSRRVCADGVVGEIWVSGSCVASGYWRRPDISERTFRARTADGAGPYMRTGDLGTVVDDQLYVTGRIKEVMIVHGRKIYPQDIEGTVQQSHDALKPAGGAVFSVDRGDNEAIIVVQEIERSWLASVNREELVSRISEAVFREHDIVISDVVLTKPETVPKTSAGKIQRVLCRDLYQRGELERAIQGRSSKVVPITIRVGDHVAGGLGLAGPGLAAGSLVTGSADAIPASMADAPFRSDQEARATDAIVAMITRWAGAHELNVPSTPYQTFAEAGFDSVSSVELTHFLENELGLELDETLLWTHTTFDSLVRHLAARSGSGARDCAQSAIGQDQAIAEAANW